MVQTEIFGKKTEQKRIKRKLNSKLHIGDDETMEPGVASELI